MSRIRSVLQIPDTVTDPKEIRDHTNRILERLQVGNLQQRGLKLETDWEPPTVAPGPFESMLRAATDAGVVKLYLYDGTNWVIIGTQS